MKCFNNEEVWNNFLEYISVDEKTNNKGEAFEVLVDKLLNRMFSSQNISFFQTKLSHDGSKDFWAIDDEDNLWWAECKNRNERLGLKELSPTLFMAELYEINHILFFSYSKLNSKVLRKIGLYATKHNKKVFIYDDDCLEYIVFKFLLKETEDFIGSSHFIQLPQAPIIDTFIEKNPLLFNSDNFDGYYEIKELEFGEIYNSNTLVINACDSIFNIEASILKNKNFRVVDKSKDFFELEPFELCLITFKIQLIFNNNQSIKFPEVRINNIYKREKHKLSFNQNKEKYICKKSHRNILVGKHYENIIEKATDCCFKNKLSVFLVYGCGGSGKTRILHECYVRLLTSTHKILNFTNFDSNNNWKDVIREITYNIFSVQDNIALDLLCNVENIEFDNNAFILDTEKKAVFKLLSLLNQNNTNEKDISKYYSLIFEKMRQGKYAVIVDNFQSYSNELVSFFESMLNFYMNCNRTTDLCLLFSINTNLIFDNVFSDFISKVINNKSNLSNAEFVCEEITGFETVEQAVVFLNSKLNLTEFSLHNELKRQIISRGTLKPKYLEQVAEYLINSGCVDKRGAKGIISDEIKCRQCLSEIPNDFKHLMEYNYNCILSAYKNKNESFKKIFAAIFLFGEVSESLITSFNLDRIATGILEKHGLIKNIGFAETPRFVVEHDLTADCLSTYIYKDLIKIAAIMVVNSAREDEVIIDKTIFILSNLVAGEVSAKFFSEISTDILEALPNRLKWHFSYHYIKNYIKYFRELDESFLEKINQLCKYVDDQISTSKAETLFALAYKAVSQITPSCNKMVNELFSFYIHMAENKTHQGNFRDGLTLYKKLEDKLKDVSHSNHNITKELDYALAYILNRRFVCGKLEGKPSKYITDLKLSRNICLKNGYWDIEFENCFDEANIYKATQKSKFMSCVNDGFIAFNKASKHQKKKYMPNFLYKKIQYYCIKQEFEKAMFVSDKALEYIASNSNINYHLFFKTKYLKYKIICMLEMDDLENISKVLQEYSVTLDLYGETENFELLYFKSLYFLHKSDNECLMMTFEKMYSIVSKTENPCNNYIQMMKDLSTNVCNIFNEQFKLDKNNSNLKEINNILCSKKNSEYLNSYSPEGAMILSKSKQYGFYF